MQMNSKERVLAAVKRLEPDRVPVDLWALPPVTNRLSNHFKVKNDINVWEALGVDLRSVWPEYIGPSFKVFDDGSWIDWWGLHKRLVGAYEEIVAPPLAGTQSVEDVTGYPWPDPGWFDYEGLRKQCMHLKEYALVIRDTGPNSTCVLRVAMYLRGMDRFLMDLMLNPEIARAILSRVGQFYLEMGRRILESVADLSDIYFIADDVGTQEGLLISPDMFADFIEPIFRQFIRQAKTYGQLIMYHSCGAIRTLIPRFIELGIDILNPIQISARDMDPGRLKEDFGIALCFHGALDVQTVLSRGTPDSIEAEVSRLCKLLGKEGGFILAPTNNIAPETPLQNILAAYKAVRG